MAQLCKIVSFTDAQRDEYRKLRDEASAAQKAFDYFRESFRSRNSPQTREYAPFEKVTMEILDQPANGKHDGGTTHAYFTKGLQ
jgi:hypothetical protein